MRRTVLAARGACLLLAALPSFSTNRAYAAPRSAPALHDPASLAVAEAARRFGLPQAWIWAVIRAESAGDPSAVSPAGAIGLMQIMPATFAGLRRSLGLGDDPFAVRDNILAGAAYLRQLYDRYGAPGFLAAYNAGPQRWEAYRRGGALPAETLAYLAKIAPILNLGARSWRLTRPVRPASSPLFASLDQGAGRVVHATPPPRVWPDRTTSTAPEPPPISDLFIAAVQPTPASSPGP